VELGRAKYVLYRVPIPFRANDLLGKNWIYADYERFVADVDSFSKHQNVAEKISIEDKITGKIKVPDEQPEQDFSFSA